MRRSLPSLARSRAAAALVTATLLLTASACGDEESSTGGEGGEGADAPTSLDDVGDTDDFAAYVATFPGVEEVEADQQEADTDFYLLNMDVGMAEDATLEQIVAVFDVVQDYGNNSPDYDETPTFSLHAADNPDHRIQLWLYEDTEAEPLAESFLTATSSPALDNVGWHVGSEAEVQIDEASLPDAASVTALAEEIAADPGLASIEGWLLPSDQNAVPRAYLGTRIGLTDEVLAAWESLTTQPGGDITLAAATLAPGLGFGEYLQDSPPLDSFDARVVIDLGDDVAPASVTEAEYGDVLLPLIEAQVAALGSLPSDENTYALNHRRDYEDTLLAELPLSDDPQYRPGKDIDPAWQEAAERAAG